MVFMSRSAGALLLAGFLGFHAAPAVSKPGGQVVLNAERMAQLHQVNSHVNGTVTEVSDMEQYGQADVWALPTSGRGDCEDFALLKRKLLVQRGWPPSALSIVVGTTSQGEAHAVLAVATDRGEYVLDNLTSSILISSETGHVFHSRQSGRGWISASGERTSVPTADFPVARTLPLAHANPRGRRG
jgi:predicted transglutaminase-like cysteine proteinase